MVMKKGGQEFYSTSPVKEVHSKQLYCPHRAVISGVQVSCLLGKFPMNCEECPMAEWVDTVTTSISTFVDSKDETDALQCIIEKNLIEQMEENKKKTELVEVYDIDGRLAIGDDLEGAVKAYREFYPTAVIKKVTRIFAEGDIVGNALMLKKSE